jgi:hypothetical protein
MPVHYQEGHLAVLSRVEVEQCRRWPSAFASERKDHRYYEIVEDTIQREFDYRYFAIKITDGEVGAIQPLIRVFCWAPVRRSPRLLRRSVGFGQVSSECTLG